MFVESTENGSPFRLADVVHAALADKATDWQNHSIRAFISGQLTKRMGLTAESAKNEAGERTSRIAANGCAPLRERREDT
jgi:hypothetical protein